MKRLLLAFLLVVFAGSAFAAPEPPAIKDDARILFLGDGGSRTYWYQYFVAWTTATAEQKNLQVFSRLNNWDVNTWIGRMPRILNAVKPDIVVFLSAKSLAEEDETGLKALCAAAGAWLGVAPTPVIADKTVGGSDDQLAAWSMMRLLGFKGTCQTLEIDAATLPADGVLPVRTERPFIGFTYEPVATPEISSFVVRVRNLATERAEISWTGRRFTLTRAELEEGVDLITRADCWTPFRNSSLALLRGVGDLTPLTVGLPDWEELLEKDLPEQDFSALCGQLEEAFRATAAERYAKYHELRQPVEFRLVVRPI